MLPTSFFFSLLSFALFIGATGYGQSSSLPIVSPSVLSSDWEIWHDPIPVSGEIRVGVMAGNNQSISSGQKSFFVFVPKALEGVGKCLCARISSIDGRYSALMEFKVADLKPGVNRLEWKSSFVNDLLQIKNEKLVILASVVETCTARAKNYLIASWKESDIEKAEVFFYANARRKPELSILSDSRAKVPFQEVDHPSLVSYTVFAKADRRAVLGAEGVSLIQKVRSGASYTFKKYAFNVL